MIVYLGSVGIVLFLSFLYDKANKGRERTLLYLWAFLILFVIMGFRYGVGQDYFFTYVPMYLKIYNGIDTGVEPGFKLLNIIASLLTGSDYQSIFVITSAIFLLCIFSACKKNDASMFLMMYIFLCGGFFFYSFNVVRQCMATAFFCTGLFYISDNGNSAIKRKLLIGNRVIGKIEVDDAMLKFFVLMGLAASIHVSALLYFPLYFFANKRYSKKLYFIFIFLFSMMIPSILSIVGTVLAGTKYGNYISGNWADTSKNFNVSQIINILIFLVFLFTPPKKADIRFTTFMNIHYLGVLATGLMGVIPLIFRVTTLFYLIQFLSVPYYYKHYVPTKYKGIVFIGILFVYGALFVNTLRSNGNRILPYAMNF